MSLPDLPERDRSPSPGNWETNGLGEIHRGRQGPSHPGGSGLRSRRRGAGGRRAARGLYCTRRPSRHVTSPRSTVLHSPPLASCTCRQPLGPVRAAEGGWTVPAVPSQYSLGAVVEHPPGRGGMGPIPDITGHLQGPAPPVQVHPDLHLGQQGATAPALLLAPLVGVHQLQPRGQHTNPQDLPPRRSP